MSLVHSISGAIEALRFSTRQQIKCPKLKPGNANSSFDTRFSVDADALIRFIETLKKEIFETALMWTKSQ